MTQVLTCKFYPRYFSNSELLLPHGEEDNQAVVYDFWVGGELSGRPEPGFQREITILYLLLWLTGVPQGQAC